MSNASIFATGRRASRTDDLWLTTTDEERKDLCVGILEEIGAESIREDRPGQLVFGCILPDSGHRDQSRNPTGGLNYRKLVANCLGCGVGGDLVWFIASMLNLDDDEALAWLRARTGTEDDESSLAALLAYFDRVYDPDDDAEGVMPRMSADVLKPWAAIHPYITDFRGIPRETAEAFRVGWNPDTNRVVMPQFWDDTLVGWQTRRVTDDGTPKYLNSPAFPKHSTIYAYEPGGEAVIVESNMSVLRHHHVCPDLESTFGAKVGAAQIRHLARHSRVTLWYDNDEPGYKATATLIEALEPYFPVYVVPSDWDADPGDMDEEMFLDLLDQRIPASLWQPPEVLRPWNP